MQVLATVECTLLECLPADCTKTETWLPLLLLADTHSQQLPQLFSRALTTASQAAVGALDGSSAAKAQPLQAFLASHDALKLSKQTLLSVMASFAAGARAVERNRLGGATFDKWEGAPPLLVSGSPCIGSYEVRIQVCNACRHAVWHLSLGHGIDVQVLQTFLCG